jgi:hypothetical protein
VSLQIKCVVESLSTESTQIAFDVTVTLDMAVEETLQWKHLVADLAEKFVICCLYT